MRRLVIILGVLAALVSIPSQAAVNLPDFTELVDKYSPVVVNVQAEIHAPKRSLGPDYDQQIPDELFRYFFGDPRNFQQPYQQRRPPASHAMGSGFIVGSDGYILTNNHVVANADKITVSLGDRDEYAAKVVGTDPRSDLALLKIDAKNLPVAVFSKNDVRVGEWVLAIGSPLGFDYSASAGIVSGTRRSLPNDNNENYIPFIQTDVAINPGNSGGPLFNLQGEVVGINSEIASFSGGYMGLSFAIPAKLAESVVKQLREKGFVTRGWLGVSIQDVDKKLASALGLDKPRGALISDLVAGSPAENALQEGDIVLEFNGAEIRKAGDLPHEVGFAPAGSQCALKVLRDRKEKMVSLKLGELPDDPGKMLASKPARPAVDNPLGLVVEGLDAQSLKELAIPGGVVVRQVVPDSPADATGLIPGDIITQLGMAVINNADDFRKQSATLPKGNPQAIRFYRRGQPAFRTILVE